MFLIVGLPIGIALVVLAVANRAPVTLILDPFAGSPAEAAYSWSVPLYLIVFATLVLGVILGGVASWWSTGRRRGAGKRGRVQAPVTQAEIERLRTAASPSGEAVPAALPRPRRSAA
ncbi:lipopolysaccharide assembly protein LapA domain-containing protein [Blastochloris viridis]|uniref:Lipopolysaccharide assembly protein A domain-containing protein n=1 Tax=Blastochloris viridis TaxID=1079 RepID=A0A0S4Q4I5_BLAVI|nr:LapA family protein [Blastochloris viridis]CUU43443.1 hypothetical protein BVIRIDIS_24640 [Blastochloris viridis]